MPGLDQHGQRRAGRGAGGGVFLPDHGGFHGVSEPGERGGAVGRSEYESGCGEDGGG